MDTLRKPVTNYIAILVALVIGTILMITSKNSETAGMAMLILPWIPLGFGLFTLLGYLLLRYLTKKWAWIITALGVAYILITSLRYFFITY